MEIPNPKKPHVLLLASPGIGHLIPFLELAKRLVSFNTIQVTCYVVISNTSTFQPHLLKSSSEFHQDLHIVDLTPANVADLVSANLSIETRSGIIMRESLANLESNIACMESPPAALIVDFFSLAAFDVADKLGVPKYLFSTGSASVTALIAYIPTLDRLVEGEFVDLSEPILVPGCRPLQPKDIMEPLLDRKVERYQGVLKAAEMLQRADGFLVNTWEELEPHAVKAFREMMRSSVYPVGPISRSVEPQWIANELFDWLGKQPNESVLYVSFGSGGTLSSDQITELAWGLEMSQQRFVWVTRPPTDTDVSSAFFGSNETETGENLGYLPNGFSTRTHGSGMVIHEWAPQEYILAHPSIGGFLSHCGWNSTLEGILNGVPILAWPLFAEQHMNAAMLAEDLGVAVRTESIRSKRLIGREEIAELVRLVILKEEGKAMRDRAKAVQDGAWKTIARGGSSYNSLAELVKVFSTNKKL